MMRIALLVATGLVLTLAHAQQDVPAKDKEKSTPQMKMEPSPAEVAKRQREIEQIEAARQRQRRAGILNGTVNPGGVPAPGNTVAPKIRPPPKAPDTKPKTAPEPDKLRLEALPPT